MLQTAWKYAREKKSRFILIYSMFVISNIIVALNPLFYGWFINQLQLKGSNVLNTGWLYVGGFLCLRLAEWLFHGPARVMERKLAFHVSSNFLDSLYHKVLHLPVKWHQENHTGSTISRLRKAHEALRDFFQNGFIYLYSFGKFLFSFAAMLYFSPLFGSIGVVLGAITVFIIIQFDKPFIKSLREVNEQEHHVSSTLFDSLSNIVTVITLRLEKRIQSELRSKLANVFPAFKRNVTINELKWFTAQMMVGLIYAVVTIGYIYQHYTPGETFMIGGLIVLLGYVNQFTSVFNDIASQYSQIVKYDTEIQNAKGLESAFEEKKPSRQVSALSSSWKNIEIEKLNFARIESATSAKKMTGVFDLSLSINRGKKIALIGESGSGKSTLLSLLRGLHEPIDGMIVRADDQPIDFKSIGLDVTLFPQDPEIFENTVLYNITLGLPFSEDEVMQVCDAAKFTDVVKNLPQGLNTVIKERGANLSGGQKQRLALARGILAARHSSIVLMDEPTSSLDPSTEKKIYRNLFENFGEKAVVSSLHRLHLLPNFDYIYILRNGEVIDEGSFEDLSKYSLVFKEMWDQHSSVTKSIQPAELEEFSGLNVAL
jgi:ATP-binding cassette, subfamily B, bacterial